MAVGFVASATSGSQASVASFNIGTLGTGARAGIVFVVTHNSATAVDTGVTWNGVAMTLIGSAADTDTEPGIVRAYFLDNVTNGTITVSRTNNATVCVGYAASISALRVTRAFQFKAIGGNGTVVTDANASAAGTAASGEVAVDDGSPGTSSMRFAANFTGAATPLAQGTNSTALQSLDSTALGSSFVRETTAGQGSRNVGFATGTTDDYAVVAVAVREEPAISLSPANASVNVTGQTPTIVLGTRLSPAAATVAITGQTARIYGTYASLVLADGAGAYYRQGETSGTTAFDEKGVHNATINNSGSVAGAASLIATHSNDGSIDYNAVGWLTSVDHVAIGPSFSFEVWVNLDTWSSSSGGLIGQWNSSNAGAALYMITPASVAFLTNDGTGAISAPVTTTGTHHVVVTYDGTRARIYYDARLVAIGAMSFTDSLSFLEVGSLGSGDTGTHPDGRLDEAAVYPTVALTAAQVAQHYSVGSGNTAVAPAGASVAVTGQTPSVVVGTVLSPAAAAIAIVGQTSTVTTSLTLSPSAATVAITGQTSVLGFGLSPTAASVVVTGQTPSVVLGTVLSPTAASVAVTGQTPTLVLGTVLSPAAATISVTGQTSTVLTPVSVSPANASVAVTPSTPTVVVNTILSPSAATLAVTGQTATVVLGTVVAPAAASVAVTGQTPSVVINTIGAPSTVTVTVTGQTPTVTATANVTASPTAAALAITGNIPLVSFGNDQVASPSPASVAVSTSTPTVTATANVSVSPSAGSIVITGQTSTIVTPVSVSPTGATVVVTGSTPTVSTPVAVGPTAAAIALTTGTPTVVLSDNVTLAPDAATVVVIGSTPTLVTPQTVSPSAATVAIVGSTPIVISGQPWPAGATLVVALDPLSSPGFELDPVNGVTIVLDDEPLEVTIS